MKELIKKLFAAIFKAKKSKISTKIEDNSNIKKKIQEIEDEIK